jgi:hypothetical protein
VTITSVADQLEYELTDADSRAVGLTSLYLQATDERDTPLAYQAYVEDSRIFFRLDSAQPAGKTILAHYTKPYTVSGLDSATDSTLPDALNVALIDGAAMYCSLSRAAGTIESNNVAPKVAETWLMLADEWSKHFYDALDEYHRQPTVKAEPSLAAWNDPQHSTEYP